jgi:hypothetical protein
MISRESIVYQIVQFTDKKGHDSPELQQCEVKSWIRISIHLKRLDPDLRKIIVDPKH